MKYAMSEGHALLVGGDAGRERQLRPRPVERRSCCPECGGDVRLRKNTARDRDVIIASESKLYACATCLSEFESLAELEVRDA